MERADQVTLYSPCNYVFVILVISHFGSDERLLVLIVQFPGNCLTFCP